MSGNHLPRMSGDQIVKLLVGIGFVAKGQKGSHRKLHHDANQRTVIVPMHKEVAEGTLRSILKQADIERSDLQTLLTKSRRGAAVGGLGE